MLGVGAMLAGPAFAGNNFKFTTGDADSNAVNISTDSGSSYINGWAGVYQGQLTTGNTTKTINLYCVDATHDVNVGDSYQIDVSQYLTASGSGTFTSGGNTYYNGGLANALSSGGIQSTNSSAMAYSTRASEVAWLADNFQNATSFSGASGSSAMSTNETAVNLAIWDIVQDGANGIGTGTLVTDKSGQQTYGTLVSYYEGLAAQHGTYSSTTAYFAQAPLGANGHYQDFVYSTAVPTPEAGTIVAMAILMLGGFAFFSRRRTAPMTAAF